HGTAAAYSSTTTHSRPGCAARARGHSRSTWRDLGATAPISFHNSGAGAALANAESDRAATTITCPNESVIREWRIRNTSLRQRGYDLPPECRTTNAFERR